MVSNLFLLFRLRYLWFPVWFAGNVGSVKRHPYHQETDNNDEDCFWEECGLGIYGFQSSGCEDYAEERHVVALQMCSEAESLFDRELFDMNLPLDR